MSKTSSLRPSLDWLLVFVPVAFLLRYVPGWHHGTSLFIISALALIPVAGWMGRATEHLAHRMGEGIGGFLNASFGNAAELIIALMALRAGQIDVVKASITGSIIGNLLLVLGLSVFVGGLRHSRQTFNKTAVRASCTALMLSAGALVIPSVFHSTAAQHPGGWTPAAEQSLSLIIAIILLATYAAMLVFSLVTHRQLFVGNTGAADEKHSEEKPWTIRRSVIVLLVATVTVAWLSEFLVGAVEEARLTLGVTETFVGVIIVAIVGNAAEHGGAVVVAYRGKVKLAAEIALASAAQVAVFLIPAVVLISWLIEPLALGFREVEIAALAFGLVVTAVTLWGGRASKGRGAILLVAYALVAIAFYVAGDRDGHAAVSANAAGALVSG